MKTCTKCGKNKLPAEFTHNKKSKDGLNYWCKVCHAECSHRYYQANKEKCSKSSRVWVEKNPERIREYRRKWVDKNWLARILNRSREKAEKYGHVPCTATEKELEVALTGFCHACGVPELECARRLSADHCHQSGHFRGWLCENCNRALGMLGDSPDRILALMKYTERTAILPLNSQ